MFKVHKLAVDPDGYRINCCSFQQDAIITFGFYQFVALYVPENDRNAKSGRLTTIGRRIKGQDQWNFVTFTDYRQTKDDGHNIISMGISGDGTIHLAWDMHGDEIHYRQSMPRAAFFEDDRWNIESFGPILSSLSGDNQEYRFSQITYPRFQTINNGDMLFEFRIGRSGLGDSHLYSYSIKTCTWQPVHAPYIRGVGNNPYIHGFDYDRKSEKIHVSWTYRDYVEDRSEGVDSNVTSQAGPNGPENNHDLHYIFSPDKGLSWFNSKNQQLSLPIDVQSDTLAVKIPKFSGIMNQEGQCIDFKGGFHVLGRENGFYHHYYREPFTGQWSKSQINSFEAKLFGARGKICASVKFPDVIFAVIPIYPEKLAIIKSKIDNSDCSNWEILAIIEGVDGEPLVDRSSLDTLSILESVGETGVQDSLGEFYNESKLRSVILIDILLDRLLK